MAVSKKMPASKPLIGITCSTIIRDATVYQCLANSYFEAITAAGGVPVIIPAIGDEECIRQIYERIDGLLLSGGVDINPKYYQEDGAGSEVTDEARDEAEFKVARWALGDDLPVLGICRGHQLLNVILNGSLYQDILSAIPLAENHRISKYKNKRDYLGHSVHFVQNTKLAHIFGVEETLVNTIHHQSVKQIGNGLIVSAVSSDGVIEGLESLKHRWVVSVQWHPEELWKNLPGHARLFQSFLDEVKSRAFQQSSKEIN